MTFGAHRMHVLVLSWHAEDGAISAGGHRRTLEVLRRFERRGDLTVIDADPTMFDVDEAHSRVVPYRVPALRWFAGRDRRFVRLVQWPWAMFSMIRLGRRECRLRSVDVVYVPSSELLPCVVAGVLVAKVCRRPLVLCNMNAAGIALGALVVWLHNTADHVIALSPALADALMERGLKKRPHIIGCGTPVQRPLRPVARRSKEWDAVFVGRHTKAKGILDLLTIWEAVREQRPTSRLALVGACSEEMARLIDARCAQRPLLNGAVVRLGVLSEREKNEVLSSSRVLLFPSRVEGWGFVPQEALVHAIPVVCWDLPAYESSLPRHPAVVRTPTGDLDRFADAAVDFLNGDDEVLSSLAADAPLDMPSWDDVADKEWALLSPWSSPAVRV